MGVNIHEPIFQIYRETTEYQTCKEKYEQAGWVPFLEKFKGHHERISLAFVQTCDGESVQFGDMKLTIIEATIAEVTGLPMVGEKYFKMVIVDRKLCQRFLKPEHKYPDWTKGIPQSFVEEEYWTMLISLQKFLTCEGRYAVTFIYHLNILSHFEGGPQIDFPHFLWMSLKKMVRGVRLVSKKPETSLHHHGLIKLLVVHALRTQGGSWKKLIQLNFSQERISKSVETQEAGIHSEGSRKKEKKDKRKTSGGKEDTVTSSSSQPIEKSVTKKFVVGGPTTSRKRKATQSHKISPILIHKDKG
jgi:hypothetical protein